MNINYEVHTITLSATTISNYYYNPILIDNIPITRDIWSYLFNEDINKGLNEVILFLL
jgi:hypothetical protein